MPDNTSDTLAYSVLVVLFLVYVTVTILILAGTWKVLAKAGQPGWAAIIPFVNVLYLLKAAGKPGWWLIFCIVPLANIVVGALLFQGLAEKFGKGTGYALGLVFLPFIFFPMLGFGSAQYQGDGPPPVL